VGRERWKGHSALEVAPSARASRLFLGAFLAVTGAACAADVRAPATGGAETPTTSPAEPDDASGAGPTEEAPPAHGDDGALPPAEDPAPGCATIDLTLERSPPTVVFAVDRSGSMRGAFSGDPEISRWWALRSALFGSVAQGTEGVVARLAPAVRFGMALYTGVGLPPSQVCPDLVEHAPALDQGVDLVAGFDAAPPPMNGKTPTGDALHAVLDALEASPPPPDAPTILVLATDGDPDTCADPTAHDEAARELSIEAVTRAHRELGIRTYVLAMGQVHEDHLQDLANAGAGLPTLGRYDQASPEERAPFWTPTDVEGLEETIASIVGGTLDCRLTVSGRLDVDRVCEGTVRLDGEPVACDAPGGGFLATSASTIELLGETCARFRSGQVTEVDASFPCDVLL